MQHVHEAAALGVLHVADAERELLEQRQEAAVARELGVLDEGQQADGVAAELDRSPP